MKLPTVENSQTYRGLYVFDFGEWTSIGYTADEIAILMESEQYRDGKAYRIHSASPDGRMELQGVSAERFRTESGTFFYRNDLDDAHRDFAALQETGETNTPPCRASIQLAERRGGPGTARYVVALIYPAEHDADMARWLLDHDIRAGDVVEGGPSHVSNYQDEDPRILERHQLWSGTSTASRSAEQVLASVRLAVQR